MTFAAPVLGLCHSAGGELEQIQFLLGHRSVGDHGEVSRFPAADRARSQ